MDEYNAKREAEFNQRLNAEEQFKAKQEAARNAALKEAQSDSVVIDGIVYSADKSKVLGTAAGLKIRDAPQSVINAVILDGVTEIGAKAFYNCQSLASVVIPPSVKTIGTEAFAFCHSLQSLTLSEGLEVIGMSAFLDCTALKAVVIPATVRDLQGEHTHSARGIFAQCKSLESVVFEESVSRIPPTMFAHCKSLVSVELPEGLKSIEQGAFYECSNLPEITFPSSLISIKEAAFQDCKSLKTVKNISLAHAANGNIENKPFGGCPIETLYLRADIKEIDVRSAVPIGAAVGCSLNKNLKMIYVVGGKVSKVERLASLSKPKSSRMCHPKTRDFFLSQSPLPHRKLPLPLPQAVSPWAKRLAGWHLA